MSDKLLLAQGRNEPHGVVAANKSREIGAREIDQSCGRSNDGDHESEDDHKADLDFVGDENGNDQDNDCDASRGYLHHNCLRVSYVATDSRYRILATRLLKPNPFVISPPKVPMPPLGMQTKLLRWSIPALNQTLDDPHEHKKPQPGLGVFYRLPKLVPIPFRGLRI
jgi:hypothetical protein